MVTYSQMELREERRYKPMLEPMTLQAEREKRETTEFIEMLKTMSDTEKAEVKGYMKCLKTIKLLTTNSELRRA